MPGSELARQPATAVPPVAQAAECVGELAGVPGCPVVVTRPEREAAVWVSALAAHGFAPVALPLMAFGPPADMAALQACRQRLADYSAVMFVSPQAVHAFWPVAAWPHGVRCWAPGPGTARALYQLGIPENAIDQPATDATQFDSEALWPVVRAQLRPGARVLVVRGEQAADRAVGPAPGGAVSPQAQPSQGSGREWLARQCEQAGAQVDFCVAYGRGVPMWTQQQRAQADRALATGAIWLLSSSESVGHLKQLQPVSNWAGARALATHPRIATSALAMGFAEVRMARPAMADVITALAGWCHPPAALG